jgi:hypothetical protein
LQLDIYSGDADATQRALPLFGQPAHFVSVRGIKDLVLESTGKPLPLLHVSLREKRDRVLFDEPQAGHTHMWCAPRGSALQARCAAAGFVPTASATVMYHRMRNFDGSWIETSEI